MTTYTYRCPSGSEFDRLYPMGAAPDRIDCPESDCDEFAYRIIKAPAISVPGGTSAGYVRR